jgi:hypothetical protein
MVTVFNRQINTGFDSNKQLITLEVLKDTKLNGKDRKTGERVEVSKSEAKRLLTISSAYFRISMD